MPGLVIPNAGAGAGTELLAQACPDTVDFTILSMASMGYGVLITAADATISPCKVTAQSSPNTTVQVAAGNVVGGGGIYSPAATASLSIAANASGNPRFDLVVYRIGTGYTVIQGTAAAAPYTAFPTPNWNTDIVLAAVYVANGFSSITNAEIVDKRQPVDYYDWSLTLSPPIQATNGNPFLTTLGQSASGAALKTLSVLTQNVGDLVMLSVYAAGATATVTAVSGGGVTTWTKYKSVNTSSAFGDLAVWYGVCTTAGTATVTITTAAAGTITLSAVCFTASLGSSTVWTLDGQPNATTSNAASGSYPITTNNGYQPELFFGAMSASGGTVGGSSTGMTYFAASGNTLQNVYSASPGTGPGNVQPTWTSTAGNNQLIDLTIAASAAPISPGWVYVGQSGAPAFATGVTNATSPHSPLRFRRIGDMVQLSGSCNLTAVTAPWTMFTLPVGYRPIDGEHFGACWDGSRGAAEQIGIHSTDGTVNLSTGSGTETAEINIADVTWAVS